MLIAKDSAGSRVSPTPGARASCPGCDAEVIAKCGDIVVWHWSHRALEYDKCDPWWEETEWHRWWKAQFPTVNIEVIVGPHRADVKLGELVIEFQHSSISLADVQAREAFYGNMIWVFDVKEPYEEGRLDIRKRPDGAYYTFRWSRPWTTIAYCRKPVFLDLGDYIFEVKKFHIDKHPAGWGYRYEIKDWISKLEGFGPYAPCAECGWKWFHGHAAECSLHPVAQWRKRKAS